MKDRCRIIHRLCGFNHSQIYVSARILCRQVRKHNICRCYLTSVCEISIIAYRHGPGEFILRNFIPRGKVIFPSKLFVSAKQS